MKTPKLAFIVLFSLLLTSCAQFGRSNYQYTPAASTDPVCFTHGSLDYRVKICYYRITYNYRTKSDESEVRQADEDSITEYLQSSSNNNRGYGYEITTDDNSANLNLEINIYTDNNDNYTWHVAVYGLAHTLPDGTSGQLFSLSSTRNYQSGYDLNDTMNKDIADRLDTFVSEGWHCD